MDREVSLGRLRREKFDVLVIGGGITGCGIALDAATRGLKVALVERRDFASGTSSKSSKLIHGGLRYLRQLQFHVTIEASREKARLKRLAPHLVEDLPFVIPIWSRTKGALVSSGLWIYDAAAGFPRGLVHKRLAPREALEALPGLRAEGLKGGFLYHDARADDCRLVLHVARKASEAGAVLANYVEVAGFLKSRGRIAGARTREFDIAASRVVNATGVWCDEVRALDASDAERWVRPSKGVHLVVPLERLGLRQAAMLPAPGDNRIVFLIPWGNRALVGTTDTDYRGDLDRPRAAAEDVEYLLRVVNANFPEVRLTRADVLSTTAGLRPLLRDDSKAPSSASREHHVFESPSGLLTLTGGKLTTYRRMAKEIVDRLTRVRCRTHQIPLFATDSSDPLARFYGACASEISDRRPLADGLPHVWGEVDFAVQREMARTVADVLARRTRLALITGDRGLPVAEGVARRMAGPMGWDRQAILREVESYVKEAEEFSPP